VKRTKRKKTKKRGSQPFDRSEGKFIPGAKLNKKVRKLFRMNYDGK
jgi:hypothetical protein